MKNMVQKRKYFDFNHLLSFFCKNKKKEMQTILNNLYQLSLYSFIFDRFIEPKSNFLCYLATTAHKRSFVS